MFTVITYENKRNGFRKIFVRRKYYIDTVSEGGLHFLLLTLNDGRRVDWRQVERILAGRTKNVLLQQGLTLPTDSLLSPPDISGFRLCFAKKAAEDILKKAADGQKENRVLLLDEAACFPDWAAMLLPYCKKLTIATRQPKAYAGQQEQSADTFALTVPEQLQALHDYTMIAAPRLTRALAASLGGRPFHCPLVCAENESGALVNGTLMTDFLPALPKAYLEEKPEGIEETEFLAAIYACMPPKEAEALRPKQCDIYLNGESAARRVNFS